MPGSLACGGTSGTTECSGRPNYTATNVWWIDVWKRNADIIYNLPNRSVELVEKLYPIYDTEHPHSDAYLGFFDRLFPQFPHPPLNNSLERNLDLILFQYCQEACAHFTPGFINRGYLETLLLPWIIQQLGLQILSAQELSVENVVTASYCTKSYKISFAPSSFYTFTLFCVFAIGWSLVVFVATFATRAIIVSRGQLSRQIV